MLDSTINFGNFQKHRTNYIDYYTQNKIIAIIEMEIFNHQNPLVHSS